MKSQEASSTAFTVVQGMLLAADNYKQGSILDEETTNACRQILSSTPEGQKRLKQLANPLFRLAAPMMERLVLPGLSLHYILRKRYIEEQALKALDDGCTQLISLGAGFDTLTFRQHRKRPEVNFIEIDHPSTSQVKQSSLSDIGDNLTLIAVDLSEHDLAQVLSNSEAFDPGRKTVFICEGVLMYLPAEVVKTLFHTLNQLTGSGTRFIFTAVPGIESPNNDTGLLLKLYLKFKDEPLMWYLERDELTTFLATVDYHLLDSTEDVETAVTYLPAKYSGALHRGEFIAVSESG